MKTKIIIASHGRFTEGIMDSLKMVAGEQGHVELPCAHIDRSVDCSAHTRQLVADHDYEKQALLVITDLLGGSVNNEFIRLTEDYPFYLVSKLNLNLLLELALYPDELKSDAIQKIVEYNSDYVVFCNRDTLHLQEENDFQEGERMIKMLRIDHRLLHGQIVLSWTGYPGVNCILIANDDCVINDLCRTMLRLTRPSSCKLIVKGIEESIVALNSGKADKYNLFIVVDNVTDVYRLASEVDRTHIVNIGGLKAGEHTYPHPSNHNINFTDGEEMMFRELADKNIDVELHMAPSDPIKQL